MFAFFNAVSNAFNRLLPCGSSFQECGFESDDEGVQNSGSRAVQPALQPAVRESKEVSLFRALFGRDDLMVHILSFGDIPSNEKKRVVSKKWKSLIESHQLWNARIYDLNKYLKKPELSLRSMLLNQDVAPSITLDQKKAFQLLNVTHSNLSQFFMKYEPRKSEYIFTLQNGEISFHDEMRDVDANNCFKLVRHDSPEIQKVHRQLRMICRNDGMKNHYQFGIVEPDQKDRGVFVSSVFNEEVPAKEMQQRIPDFLSITKTHRTMFYFLRILNTLAAQKRQDVDLKERFRSTSSGVIFEDVTNKEVDLITSSISSSREQMAEKVDGRTFDSLCNEICPEDIFNELPLPLYSNRFSGGESVVVQRSDRSYRFAKILSNIPVLSWNMFGVPEKEFVYTVIVRRGGPQGDELSKSMPAGQIYSIPERLKPQLLQLMNKKD